MNAKIDRTRDRILAEEAAELDAARHRAFRDGRAYVDEIKRAGLLDGLAGDESPAEREQTDPKFAALIRPFDGIRERWGREEAAIYAHSLEKMTAAVARLRQTQGQP
jgi:hypothetical protein